MEGIVSDIRILANSLYSCKRPQSLVQISPVRRVRSSTASSKSSIKKRGSIGRQFPSFRRESNHRAGSVSSSFSDSIRGRSSSASSSMKSECDLSSTGVNRIGYQSISVEGSWTYDNAIPELPESPSLVSVTSYSHSSNPSSQESSISGTFQKKAEFAISPVLPHWHSAEQHYTCLVTSTPNMQYCGTDFASSSDNYYTLPSKTATKGKVHHYMMFSSDNLNEVDGCLEESSKSQEKAFVVRRSSLTGQLEKFQKPWSKEMKDGMMQHNGYRVLNKGVRKSLKRRSSKLDQMILPSVETTV